jgi:hypothetical protein
LLHGATAIALCLWVLLALSTIKNEERKSPPWPATWTSEMEWSSRKGRRGFFVLALGDVVFILSMIIACGLVSTDLPQPWSFSSCSTELCQSEMTVEWMAIVHILHRMTIMAAVVPVMRTSRIVSGPLFIMANHLQHLRSPSKTHQLSKYDLEKASLAVEDDEITSLSSLFRCEAVAIALARNLHLDDVANVSLASKGLRRAVLFPASSGKDTGGCRKDLFYENSCDSGVKRECWACGKVVCKTCQVSRSDIPVPRTQSHIIDCHATCSRCFFLDPEDAAARSDSAPRAATWRRHDLAVQHTPVCETRSKRPGQPQQVPVAHLCPSCAVLEAEAVRGVREARDEAALKRMLGGRVRCRVCDVVLGPRARRWWICEGGHECRWAGHDVQRS